VEVGIDRPQVVPGLGEPLRTLQAFGLPGAVRRAVRPVHAHAAAGPVDNPEPVAGGVGGGPARVGKAGQGEGAVRGAVGPVAEGRAPASATKNLVGSAPPSVRPLGGAPRRRS
jgi:hypothetical protein